MKKSFIIAALAFSIPFFAGAHGGVSKNIGNAIVFLNQSPLSPLVGEKVDFNFVLTDPKIVPLANTNASLTLTDTFFGDESKDKIILTKNFTTDNNGDFTFSHTFNKENYFDIDLDFKDPITGQNDSTGFLVQIRNGPNKLAVLPLSLNIYSGLGGLLLGLLFGFFIEKRIKKAISTK